MKKCLVSSLLVLLIAGLFVLPSQGNGESYSFSLAVDGKETLEVLPDQIISVTLTLTRVGETAYPMYGMQAELRYDPAFLEILPDTVLFPGVRENDIATQEGYREHYLNFLSVNGGALWTAETLVATVKFRVIGISGVSKIENTDFLVSLPDGSGSYPCASNALTLIRTTDCTVTFRCRGGSEILPQKVEYGEKIKKPKDPTREGYTFAGWYKDLQLTQPWDFDNDTVDSNLSLFAKWVEGTAPGTPQNPLFSIFGICVLILSVLLLWTALLMQKDNNIS